MNVRLAIMVVMRMLCVQILMDRTRAHATQVSWEMDMNAQMPTAA